MADKTVKMKTADGSVINVAEQFVSVFEKAGYIHIAEEKPKPEAKPKKKPVSKRNEK